MSQTLPEIDVLFVAGFGPISRDTESSTAFMSRHSAFR